jgi:hypothetical protein
MCEHYEARQLFKTSQFIDTSVYGNNRGMRVPFSGKYDNKTKSIQYGDYVHG